MAISFPSSPSTGQIFTDPSSGNQYQWNGTVWVGRSPITISGDRVGIGTTIPQYPLTVGFNTLGNDPVLGGPSTSLYVQGSVTVTDQIRAKKVFGVNTFDFPIGNFGDLSAPTYDVFGISTITRFDVSNEPSNFNSIDLGELGTITYTSVQWAKSTAGIHTLSNVGVGTTNPTTTLEVNGTITASSFTGDGSGLTGITAVGTGVSIFDSDSIIGVASAINFGTNLAVTPVSAGVVTVTASGGGGQTYWSQTSAGIHTLSKVGIGTTNPTNALSVSGDANVTRHLNITGVVTASSVEASSITVGSAVTLTAGGVVAGLGTINYINATHINATGVITAFSFSGSNTLKSRTVVSGITTVIANNGIGNTNITGYKAYSLLKVGLSTAGWLRLYTDSTSRTNDVTRSVGEDPAAGSGVIAEVVTTGLSTTQIISPFVMGGNLNDPADTTIYAAITNLSGITTSISVNLTLLQLEV